MTTLATMTLSISAQAGEWEILPVLNDSHKLNTAVAIIGGSMQGDESGSESDSFYGLEVSMDCPLIKVPTGKIRQQINLTTYDDGDIAIRQFNLNPHYQIPLSSTLTMGVGPSFGIANVEILDQDDTIFTYGVGTSLRAELTKEIFIGAEARYELTTDADLFNIEDDFNNLKFFAKVGYQF